MSLTLDCVCAGADAMVCTLTDLVFVYDLVQENVSLTATMDAVITWYIEAPSFGLVYFSYHPAEGNYEVELTPLASWKAAWGDIRFRMFLDQTQFEVPEPPMSSYDRWTAGCHINQHYQCYNPVTQETILRVVRAFPTSGSGINLSPSPGRSICFGGGGLNGTLYKSTPLGDNQCGAFVGTFKPDPEKDKIDFKNGDPCLCAQGGSDPENYRFSIASGLLPSGKTLNPLTGCIEGEGDGQSPGTDEIEFIVQDMATSETATVICGFLEQCLCEDSDSVGGNSAY